MFGSVMDVDAAWDLLASIEGNPVCECTRTGESWQYVGANESGMVFEHLHHPITNRRQLIVIKNGKVVCNS